MQCNIYGDKDTRSDDDKNLYSYFVGVTNNDIIKSSKI